MFLSHHTDCSKGSYSVFVSLHEGVAERRGYPIYQYDHSCSNAHILKWKSYKLYQHNLHFSLDVLLHMYGSSLTGFGLKGADINVNLSSSDKDRKLTFLLKEVHSTMRDKPGKCLW